MPPRLVPPQTSTKCILHKQLSARSFTSTAQLSKLPTRQRQDMWTWLNGPGANFRAPLPDSTNYLGAYDKMGNLIRASEGLSQRRKKESGEQNVDEDQASDEAKEAAKSEKANGENALPKETVQDLQPFKLNTNYYSESVLSEDLKNEILRRIVEDKQTVRQVSQELSVEMSRIGAVVRLKTVEQDWVKEGKKLAKPYARSVLAMLPQTPFNREARINPRHESINDLPVHAYTTPQIFKPVSESRQFTRADAGRAFNANLKAPEERIPHPDMVLAFKDEGSASDRVRRREERFALEVVERRERAEKKRKQEEKRTTVIGAQRWDFKFKDVSVEDAGADGRNPRGVGWRYGLPLEDRKVGQIKIPRSVD